MYTPLEVLRLHRAHDGTLADAFAGRTARDPERPFLRFGDRRWSWRGFGEAATAAAALFRARGITKGDRVAVMARNSDGHALALFALARLGAIMVPVNPDLGVEEARYVLHHAEVAGVIASTETLATARAASAGLARAPWFMTVDAPSDDAPSLFDLLGEAPGEAPPAVGGAEDTCLIVYTSGTTGFPKGAMHSQRNFVTAGEAFVQRVHLQPDDRVMIILPMYHINALFYSLAGTLAAGCDAVVMPRFSASAFWDSVADTGTTQVNVIEAVGTILQARPRDEFRKDHHLRAIYGVRENVRRTFREEFGVPHLVSGYGMTEIPGVTCSPLEGPSKPGSMGMVGRHPDPDRAWARCRIVDDQGRDVGPDMPGELWVDTPIVMQGYFRDPEQTAAAFEGRWFKTGDLVRRDAEGWFFFVSRIKDIIRRRGENIAGAEIDRVLGEHPDVFEVAAIGVPAELGEEEILVAVVAKQGRTPTAEALAEWCRERLAPMKVPRYVLFVDDLPHTATHKIAKAVLRREQDLVARATDLGAPARSRPSS